VGFVIPENGPPIAPQARGVHLRILGPTGDVIIDQHVPAGFYTASSPVGWKVAGDPATKFTYLDKTKPPTQNGIKKIVITDKSAKARGLITVVVNGDAGSYPLAPGETPITVALELNDTSVPAGRDARGRSVRRGALQGAAGPSGMHAETVEADLQVAGKPALDVTLP
jgi:hypothetical protein